MKAIALKTGDLPPLPGVALRALDLIRDPYVSARELQEVISEDQGLAAKILRIVNSPLYALVGEVSTLSHAIAILGLERSRSILMAATVQHVFQSGAVRTRDLGSKLLSDHSWGAATACRLLAQRCGYANPEEAFLCGLMHDLGKPVLLKNIPDLYIPIINEVYLGKTTFHEAEMVALGFSHSHVGALLTEKWNFPPRMSEAINYHHNPEGASIHAQLAALTHLANRLMGFLGIGFERQIGEALDKQPSATMLGISSSRLEALVAEIKCVVSQLPKSFAF